MRSSNDMNTPGSARATAPLTRKVVASNVLPQPGPPHTRVGLPAGRPPPVNSSRPAIPLGISKLFDHQPPTQASEETLPGATRFGPEFSVRQSQTSQPSPDRSLSGAALLPTVQVQVGSILRSRAASAAALRP